MAAPFCRIALRPWSSAESFNLTALTGGVSDATSILGYTGADWYHAESGGSYKLQGGQQLTPVFLAPLHHSVNVPPTNPITWDADDSIRGGNNIARTWSWPDSVANVGVHWPSIIADQKARRLHCIVESYNGTVQATATLGDSSVAPRSLTLPVGGRGSFTVEYRSVRTTTMDLELRFLTAGIDPQIWFSCIWIEVPVAPARPRST